MENDRSKEKSFGAGGAVLLIALAFALAALVVVGLYIFGSRQPTPPSEERAAALKTSSHSLLEQPEEILGSAPARAEAPEVSEAAESSLYKEIIAEEEGLTVYLVQGKRWRGLLAVVDDPQRVTIGTCGYFDEGKRGLTVQEMADASGAVLAVNGGGFSDDGGNGLGGMPTGNVVEKGVLRMGYTSHTVGIDYDGRLFAGYINGAGCVERGLRWALSYGPTLITDGVICEGLSNDLEEPRTAVGQREDGSILILALQGRQVSALGVTNLELAHIMQELGAVNAGNMDGGASSYMYYGGEYINISNTGGYPRPIPTGILVMPAGYSETASNAG